MGVKVFISYSHDSIGHRIRVLELSNRLREDGIECVLDRYEQAPAEGWQNWMQRQIEEADFVLVVCTEEYADRASGREQPGVGRGTRFESALIIQGLYDAGMLNRKFIPVVFGPYEPRKVLAPLRQYTVYQVDLPEDYDRLCLHLTRQKEVQMPPVGPRRHPPPAKTGPGWRRFRWLATVPALLVSVGLIWIVRQSLAPPELDSKARRDYQAGLIALRAFNPHRAKEILATALESNDFPQIRSAYAEALLQLGRLDDATRESEKALKRARYLPENERWMIEARHASLSGDWENAIHRYEKLHELYPQDADYVIGKAEAQIGNKGFTDALETLKAMEGISNDPRLALTKARAAESMSNYPEQRDAASQAFKQARQLGYKSIQAQALLFRAFAVAQLGEAEQALADLDEAERLSRGQNQRLLAQVLQAKGDLHLALGDLNTGRQWLLEAEKTFRQLGDTRSAVVIQTNLASVAAQQGDLERARWSYTVALKQYEEIGDNEERARTTANLGLTWLHLGQPDEAIPLLDDARAYYQGKDRAEEAWQQCNLGAALFANLQLASAEAHLAECCTVACDILNEQIVAIALQSQGDLLFHQGNTMDARKKFERSIEIFERIGNVMGAAQGRLLLATIELDSGKPETAIQLAEQARAQFHDAGALEETLAGLVLVRAYLPSDPGAARRELARVEESAAESQVLELRVRYALTAAALQAAQGRVEAAFKRIEEALAQTRTHPAFEMETRLALAELELKRNPGRGRQQLAKLKSDAEARGSWRIEADAAALLGETSSRPAATGRLAGLKTAPPPTGSSSCPCSMTP